MVNFLDYVVIDFQGVKLFYTIKKVKLLKET